jgi:NADH-quinone oxidoreductase subunit G/NADP-reducing hydrogenase subunit HndD
MEQNEQNKKINIIIDGKEIEAKEGQTVLEAAKAAGIEIPALCYHPDLCVKANCRLCLVEIEGAAAPATACSTQVKDGIKVKTDSDNLKALRKTNLELILGEHRRNCVQCIWQGNCALLKCAREFGANLTAHPLRKPEPDIVKFGPIILDRSKCIECRNCVDMCARQTGSRRGTDTEMKSDGFLEIDNRGKDIAIKPSDDPQKDCIYCGQCVVHCPVGALDSQSSVEEIDARLKDKKGKTLVVQFAPSIRTGIGEIFGIEYGRNITGQLVASLKKLGFDKVFDTSMAADLTTVEEAKELVERVKENKPLPMFTSCCPAWMRYIEFFRPDLIPNITTAKSPQNMLGSLIKTYWAQKNNIDPQNIISVSIMPCTAKKYDITKEEEKINGLNPVDYVLTTRELGRLLQKNRIDLKDMSDETADDPFGLYTGAGVIFGATGGVTEAATRTAYWLLTGRNLEKIDCENVRGIVGLKKAEIDINGVKLKIGIASGMENAKIILDDLSRDPKAYDYIEVMACPGGCIGGGGQPLPVNDEIRKKRAAGLYSIDCAKEIRFAHESPAVKAVYDDFAGDEHKIHEILHTHYTQKPKTSINKTN